MTKLPPRVWWLYIMRSKTNGYETAYASLPHM